MRAPIPRNNWPLPVWPLGGGSSGRDKAAALAISAGKLEGSLAVASGASTIMEDSLSGDIRPATSSAPRKYFNSTSMLGLPDSMASARRLFPSVTKGTPSSLTTIKIESGEYPFSEILFLRRRSFSPGIVRSSRIAPFMPIRSCGLRR